MTPMDEQSAVLALASFERQYELADQAWIHTRTSEAWERVNDLARTIREHCVAYGLIPSVDVGACND